jgi:4-nitrophenyl phosphatase
MGRMDIGNIKAVAFDMDGTICFGKRIARGALELVGQLRKSGIHVLYCTNSSSASRNDIYRKLSGFEIDLRLGDVYSASCEAGIFVRETGFRKVFCLGGRGLVEEIRSNGVSVTDQPAEGEAIVVGLDTDLTYGKIASLVSLRSMDIPIIACNRDMLYPVEGGRLVPGCGLMVSIVEEVLGRKAHVVVGKPNTLLLERMSQDQGFAPREILVVGDSVESDIAAANAFGSPSVLLAADDASLPRDQKTVSSLQEIGSLFFGSMMQPGGV